MTGESWKRIPLWFLLFCSIAFNYILLSDNAYMEKQMNLMEKKFIADVIGYDYCGEYRSL